MEKNCYTIFTSLRGDLYNEFLDHYLTTLPWSLQRRLKKYTCQRDRYLSLAGKFLLSRALDAHGFDGTMALENFRYSDKGRPYIEGMDVDFNISHSGDLVTCAFSTSAKVGIDLQKKMALTQTQANLYFKLIEGTNCPEDMRADYVIEVWTRKEAVSKLVGDGLSIAFKQVLVHEDIYQAQEHTIYLYRIPVPEGYTCTLATSQAVTDMEIAAVDIHELQVAGYKTQAMDSAAVSL
jgi:4'-phosphopantetheinyl transferase